MLSRLMGETCKWICLRAVIRQWGREHFIISLWWLVDHTEDTRQRENGKISLSALFSLHNPCRLPLNSYSFRHRAHIMSSRSVPCMQCWDVLKDICLNKTSYKTFLLSQVGWQ
jgi:hypothetical protein